MTAVEGVHEGTVLWRVPPVVDRPQVCGALPAGRERSGRLLCAPERARAAAPARDRADGRDRRPCGTDRLDRGRASAADHDVRAAAPAGAGHDLRPHRLDAADAAALRPPGGALVPAAPLRAADRRLLDRGAARAVGARQLHARITPQTVARQGVEDPTWWLGLDAPRRGRCATRRCRSGWAARRWRHSPRPSSSGSTRSTRPSPTVTGATRRAFLCREVDPACLIGRSPSCTRTAGSCSWCGTSATWSARCSRSTSSAA